MLLDNIMTCPAVMTDERFFGFCYNILSVVAPFTYLFVLMTDDVNYTYFMMRFIYEHKTINIVLFFYLFTAHPVVL